MNLSFRTGALFLTLLALTHCAGPNGRRIIGGQYLNGQSENALTGWQNPFSRFVYPPQQQTSSTTSEIITPGVEYRSPDWNSICKQGSDFDHDGLSDDCEKTLRNEGKLENAALNPYVYNGVVLGGRYFDKDSTKLDLTDDEKKELKQDQKTWGCEGFGTVTTNSKKLIQKFCALKKRSDPDTYAFKELFNNKSDEPVRIDQRFAASARNPEVFQNSGDDLFMALARGDGSESVPFSTQNVGDSLYFLTGFGKDTDSKRARQAIMETIEFHVALPRGVDEMQVAIGYLSNQNSGQLDQSKSGIYYVINDGESILIQNGLVSDHQKKMPDVRYGTIHRSVESCTTSHIIIVYFSDATNNGFQRTRLFAENIFYRINPTEPWRNFTQGMLSLQPQGGATCDQVYNGRDPNHKNMFFRTTTGITSRVNGYIDFNSSLNPGGPSNSSFILTSDPNTTGSATDIFNTALKQIPNMGSASLDKFEESFSQVDPSTLSDDDKKLFVQVGDALKARKAVLSDPTNPDNPYNVRLNDLERQINGLDPAAGDFQQKKGDLQKEIDALKSDPNLSPDQMTRLKGLETALNSKIAAANKNEIQLDPKGTAELTLPDMLKLKGLGFSFRENGQPYDPATENNPKMVKNLTPAELQRVLDELDKKWDSLTPAQKAQALQLLNDLKDNKGVDPKAIDQFINDHPLADKEIQIDPTGNVGMPLNTMKKLDGLGQTFKNPDGSTYDPKTETDPNMIKKTQPNQVDELLGQLDQDWNNLTPQQKADAHQALDDLKKNGAPGAPIDDFKSKHPLSPTQQKEIQLAEPPPAGNGTIKLPLDQMKTLAGLGYTFKNPDGTAYDPLKEKNPNAVKNITPEELDRILDQLGKDADAGKLTPQQKAEANRFLDGLKNAGVDPAKIDKFRADHPSLAAPANEIQLAEPSPAGNGTVKLPLDNMKTLQGLGFTFKDPKGNNYNPAEETNPNAVKNITPQELEETLKELDKKWPAATPEQKKDIYKALNALKKGGADPTKINDFKKAHPLDLGKTIQLDRDGEVKLPLDQMRTLAGLGYVFKNPDGTTTYDPFAESNPDAFKKISPEELDNILTQLGKDLDSGTLDPGKKDKIAKFLLGVSKNDPESKEKVEEFMRDHADDLAWNKPQMDALSTLDNNPKLSPKFGPDNLNKWAEGFEPTGFGEGVAGLQNEQAAKKLIADEAMKKLTAPEPFANLSPEEVETAVNERIAAANSLRDNGFLDNAQLNGLMLQLFKLKDPALAVNLLGKVVELPDGRLAFESATILFTSGANNLQSNAEQALKPIGALVKYYKETQNVVLKVKINAYTDNLGDDGKNLELSNYRAYAVRDYLIGRPGTVQYSFKYGKGETKNFIDPIKSSPYDPTAPTTGTNHDYSIPEVSVTTEGFGEANPIASNKTTAGQAKNRRVVIILSK